MAQVTIHEAKTNLSKLIQRALQGEEVVIARGRRPLVKLVVLDEVKAQRRLGSAAGQIELAEDFDAPLDAFSDYRP